MLQRNTRAAFLSFLLGLFGSGPFIDSRPGPADAGIEGPSPVLASLIPTAYSVTSIVRFGTHDLPRVAVIIDDAGNNLSVLEHLVELPFAVTVSVIPGSLHDAESAGWAKRHGFEIMVHLPMEPEAYPEKDPGENAILTSMSKRKLQEITLDLIEEIPYASGVNNHMGSRFTQSAAKMNPVLNMIARKELYFVDSRTTPFSVGFQVAQSKRIPSAQRSLFLDDSGEPEKILERFRELADLARVQRSAIGIAHLKSATLEALKSVDPADYRDIQFVFASELCFVKNSSRLVRNYGLNRSTAPILPAAAN